MNKEVKRRTNVLGIFPNSLLSEQPDEWQVSKRYFSAGSLVKLNWEEWVANQPELVAG